MNNNIIDIYTNLYQLTKITFNLYQKLSKSYDNNYNKYLKLLKLQIMIEKTYYNTLTNNEILLELLDMINNNSLYEFNIPSIMILTDIETNSELINYRIYKNILQILKRDSNYFITSLDDDLKIYSSNEESTNYLKEITIMLEKEETRNTLSQLQYYNITKLKYLFINPLIEEEIINNDFNIQSNNFNDNISLPNKYDVFKNYIYSKYGLNHCFELIEEMIYLSNDPELDIYDNESYGYNCLNLFQISLKTNLLFIETNKIENLYEYYLIVLDKEKLKINDEEPEKEERLEFISNLIETTFDNNDTYRQSVNKDSKNKKLIK